jgi:hypothetical protein
MPPRVHYVKSARKDNPVAKKGEPYYWWQSYCSPKQFSKTPPRPSQLTNSDKLSRAYCAQEVLCDALNELSACSHSDFNSDFIPAAIDARQTAMDEAQEIADEYRESAENIREHFSESETADQCDESADNLENWISELEGVDLEESEDDCDTIDNDEVYDYWTTKAQGLVDELQNADLGL